MLHRLAIASFGLLPWAAIGAQAPAKAPPTVTLTGTCSGLDAAAVGPARLSLWLHDYRREGAQLVRDVRADAAGHFTIAEVPWLQGHDWGSAFFVLHARHGDRVGLAYLRGDEAAAKALQVALAPGIAVRGVVRDDAGKPLAGARVHVAGMHRAIGKEPLGELVFFAEPVPQWTAVAAADGTFILDHVLPGWTLAIEAVHDGHVRTRRDVPPGEAGDFGLEPAAAIHGRVVHADGKPAVRVRVCAQGTGGHHGWATARTEADGSYRLLGLPRGAYNLWAEAEDLTVTAIDSQPAAAGEVTTVTDLVLVAGGFVVGKVVDADTGLPVQPGASADVAMYGPARPRSGGACECEPILADGTFRLRAAPGAVYVYLRAEHEGWHAVSAESFDLTVEAGATQTIEFRVRKAKGGAKAK